VVMKVVRSDPDPERCGDERRKWDRGDEMLHCVLAARARLCGCCHEPDQLVFENRMSR
jgi:hypothetical protein